MEGSLKLKNLFGFADIWDTSGAFGWDQSLEISTGVWVPRFRSVPTPLSARVFLLSQDWLKFSSYKERLMGLSFGLLSLNNHDLSYNLTWRTLTDPTRMSSPSIRRQLGHNVLSALKYCYKIDRRNSHLRPRSGYAFSSSSQVSGLWDIRSLKFFRQVLHISMISFCLVYVFEKIITWLELRKKKEITRWKLKQRRICYYKRKNNSIKAVQIN